MGRSKIHRLYTLECVKKKKKYIYIYIYTLGFKWRWKMIVMDQNCLLQKQ